MTSTTCHETLSVDELSRMRNGPVQWIDVRSPSEFASGHIPGAINIPMDEIESRLADLRADDPIVLICQGGKRAAMTHGILDKELPNLAVLHGGTDAWAAAGLPLVSSTRSRWSLERQVRVGAGALVLIGILLGLTEGRAWLGLSAFVGAGLVVAGTTNYCAMANLLALLPWNRRGNRREFSNCGPCA